MANFIYFQSFNYMTDKKENLQYPILYNFTTLNESQKERIM